MKKTFRSILKKYFPLDLVMEIHKLTEVYNVSTNIKGKILMDLLTKYNVPFNKLGTGTNRYGIQVEGYAIKIALDSLGMVDNKREFLYGKTLYPDVVKAYEIYPNGLMLVTEYITVFSIDDLVTYGDKMRSILKDITKRFFVGDVGIVSKNYANWGIRNEGNDDIAILDFAYIYDMSYNKFTCTCEDKAMLQYDNDYNTLICPVCNKKFNFFDIRRRISNKDQEDEIGDISRLGYTLHSEVEECEIDPEKTYVNKKKNDKYIIKEDKHPKVVFSNTLTEDESIANINKILRR